MDIFWRDLTWLGSAHTLALGAAQFDQSQLNLVRSKGLMGLGMEVHQRKSGVLDLGAFALDRKAIAASRDPDRVLVSNMAEVAVDRSA